MQLIYFFICFIDFSNLQAEREFRDYIRDKTSSAKQAFKELVQECKLITHKSWEMYKENHNHLKDIEEILKNDKRFVLIGIFIPLQLTYM